MSNLDSRDCILKALIDIIAVCLMNAFRSASHASVGLILEVTTDFSLSGASTP